MSTEKPEKFKRPGAEKYTREAKKARYSTKNRRLNAGLKRVDQQYRDAVNSAAGTDMLLQEEAGFLEADGPMEKTFKFKQDDIVEAVDVSTANKRFELKLNEFGPYRIDYTRNGRGLLIAGRLGHVASMDWRTGKLDCELHLGETVHAAKYLHNNQYFAAAQRKYTFIYDKLGIELHRLNKHVDCTLLDFLPYHFLLVTAGRSGFLRYQDVSTGDEVSEIRTKLGPTQALKQNPWNGVMHLGHAGGVVSLWSPKVDTPLVKVQSSRGPVRDIAIDREGKYMAVSGMDKSLKIWDLRKFEVLESYWTATPASSLDISDNGLLSVGWGPHVTVWKDAFTTKQEKPYMTHLLPGSKIENIRYVPYEDILGVGHSKGVSSLIIPGSGEANFDSLEANPFETTTQRQQAEVKGLLNKLPADTIMLDPNVIGTVNSKANSYRAAKKDEEDDKPVKKNVVDARTMHKERIKRLEQLAKERGEEEEEEQSELDSALARFK